VIKSREKKIGGACSTYGTDEKCTYIFVGKPQVKRSLVIYKTRWADLKEI
jgi:hypothetical protein